MAKFISVSGPSATGKSTIIEILKNNPELKHAKFLPSMYSNVWDYLVDVGQFEDFSEIIKDTEYLAVYLLKLIDYQTHCLHAYSDRDDIVVFDECWLDLSIYALLNMWHTHTLKELQTEILAKINKLSSMFKDSRIYITKVDRERRVECKYKSEFKNYNVKFNRPLEEQYYRLYSNFNNVVALEDSDELVAANYIISDLKEVGYL